MKLRCRLAFPENPALRCLAV